MVKKLPSMCKEDTSSIEFISFYSFKCCLPSVLIGDTSFILLGISFELSDILKLQEQELMNYEHKTYFLIADMMLLYTR